MLLRLLQGVGELGRGHGLSSGDLLCHCFAVGAQQKPLPRRHGYLELAIAVASDGVTARSKVRRSADDALQAILPANAPATRTLPAKVASLILIAMTFDKTVAGGMRPRAGRSLGGTTECSNAHNFRLWLRAADVALRSAEPRS